VKDNKKVGRLASSISRVAASQVAPASSFFF
jgi:hypothetical protein